MKLDILVIAVHPDDAELGCGGTIASHVAMGKKVGILDLTAGELGTRGTVEIRASESAASSKVLGISVRENLGFSDGFFVDDREHQLALIKKIRKFRPELVIANAIKDRHPDHGRAAELTRNACFLSGLRMIETDEEGKRQEAWRPAQLWHMVQSVYIAPDIVVDVSDHWKTKMDAIRCFKSQFDASEGDEPGTFLTTPLFMKFVEARGQEYGHAIGAAYGEGFTNDKQLGVNSLFDLKLS
ncbi:bacillithiol biosynthesis deacetylase BshB1 [Catalinimonas alkaloidigena]|uniref:bacillithiol biosynthesis deacetylase BshB1 n=1 Tax=Catalinimonas alkaloidigena TaxID=1075417 RepID=UPI002405ACE1|nr:bacillithiol biosynthesis deacetylase BshB1 [Catalinimonas alkaloidigena]MDF9797268.1 bacillithiol biosynthesis deacetylase BshB1 [Catalinimonas alkaloidigena]